MLNNAMQSQGALMLKGLQPGPLLPSLPSNCLLRPPLFHSTLPLSLLTQCALAKQGQRFLASVSSKSTSDPSAINRSINKFIVSSPKSVVLSTLSHLLSPNAAHPHLHNLALPLYTRITEATWFSWNSKLAADVIAFLHQKGQLKEAEALMSETISRVCSKERELVSFYCNLLQCHAKLKSVQGVFETSSWLKGLISTSSSTYVQKRAYESLVGGFCVIGLPHEGESLILEMKQSGIKPSVFEFRSLIEGYGRIGLFKNMLISVAEMESSGGFKMDIVCSNMVLSSYGAYNRLPEMVYWLQKVKGLGIGFSIRTYNSVLNSCPKIISMLQDSTTCPISMEELLEVVKGDEALLVQELIGTTFLDEIVEWNSLELKLDLHGMHLATAYVIMLQWVEELRSRLDSGEYEIPHEVVIVCGIGKRSTVRGNSPVKALIKELVRRTKIPMRIDRKNNGCFVAKGKVVKDWLRSCNYLLN